VHTTDAIGALARLRDMGVPPYLLTATLQGVLAQRLVRRICDRCGEWHPVTDGERAVLGGDGLTTVRAGHGCDDCSGTGYRGRQAITELVVMTDPLREAFARGERAGALRAMARAQGVASLRDDGVRLVRAGGTTVAELARVLSAGEDG
jgi:type II secretory ATPase GspE/PulE/Tfp pilus assembly ATPase PilB-like protein